MAAYNSAHFRSGLHVGNWQLFVISSSAPFIFISTSVSQFFLQQGNFNLLSGEGRAFVSHTCPVSEEKPLVEQKEDILWISFSLSGFSNPHCIHQELLSLSQMYAS